MISHLSEALARALVCERNGDRHWVLMWIDVYQAMCAEELKSPALEVVRIERIYHCSSGRPELRALMAGASTHRHPVAKQSRGLGDSRSKVIQGPTHLLERQ